MLSNAYFLAKIRFDTAENEPANNLQKFANFEFSGIFRIFPIFPQVISSALATSAGPCTRSCGRARAGGST